MDIRGAKGPIVEKGVSSIKNYPEVFCETCFCSVHSINRVEAYFLFSSSQTTFLVKLHVVIHSAKGPIVANELSINENYTKAFCETPFCSVHSTNRVEAYFCLSSSETHFL